jgi:hypothetical protein
MSAGLKLAENERAHKRISNGFDRVVKGSPKSHERGFAIDEGRIYGMARKLLGHMDSIHNYRGYMNNSGSLTVSESATRRVKKAKGQKRSKGRTRNGKTGAQGRNEYDTTMAAAGTLTRTKALLLAALKVWELKHRIHDQER